MNPLASLPPEYLKLMKRMVPRPKTWDNLVGNETAKEIIREAIVASQLQGRPAPHLLLYGPPGMGKSTASKLIAQDMGGGYVETTASTLETQADVIRILWELNDARERTGRPSVLFLDEIHMLGQAKRRQAIDQESIYPLLEDWQFPHNLVGKEFTTVHGERLTLLNSPLYVWPFTLVGSTTEPGMLSQPLLRRFLLQVELEPYSEDDIARIIEGAAGMLEWPIEAEAAAELAKYSRRNPGRAYALLTAARNRTVATARDTITEEVVEEIVSRQSLFALGLTSTDVRVLKVLAARPKGVGQAEICRAVGISQSQFSGMIEPYLRQLSLIETLSRRMIRPEGLAYLTKLGKIDSPQLELAAGSRPAMTV
jgi:Holliday junction DNA helicase RuvB